MTRTEVVLVLLGIAFIAAGGVLLALGHVWAVALILLGLALITVANPGLFPW